MNAAEKMSWDVIPPFRLIDAPLRQVRDLICRSLTAAPPAGELSPFLEHLLAHSGKMLRPGLLLLAGRCFGPLTGEHLGVSAVVEMIHHATLLHDDVIDDGRTRRGAPTANCLWGNESAVLLGDFVLSQVFRMVSDFEPAVARVVAQTAVRVCEGELRQVMQKGNWRLTEAQYIDIITEKSAAFFSGSCRLGGLLARADEEHIEALARFGLLVGVAFQMTDDLLDIAGDEDRTGKTARSDFAKDKVTLAVIHLLRTVDAADRAEVEGMLESQGRSGHDLAGLLERHGSLSYTRAQAQTYVAAATKELQGLPSSEAREALVETAQFMVARTT